MPRSNVSLTLSQFGAHDMQTMWSGPQTSMTLLSSPLQGVLLPIQVINEFFVVLYALLNQQNKCLILNDCQIDSDFLATKVKGELAVFLVQI